MAANKGIAREALANEIMNQPSVLTSTINGALAGFGVGLVGVVAALSLQNPSRPGKVFGKLAGTFLPLTTLGGLSFAFTNRAMLSGNVNDVKAGATAGCVSGALFGVYKSSVSSMCLGCGVGAALGASTAMWDHMSGTPASKKPLREPR